MLCWLIPVYLRNIFADLFEKKLAKSKYLASTVTSSAISKAIWVLGAELIVIFDVNKATCTTKAF